MIIFQETANSKTNIIAKVLLIITLAVSIGGCVATKKKTQVIMTDNTERGHLNTKLNMTDLLAVADNLTNKMLESDVVEQWFNNSENPDEPIKPKIIIGNIINRTDIDNNFPEEELYDRIVDIILVSGVARIVGGSSNEFDYILTGKINSTVAHDSEFEQRQYRITLRLHNDEDELLGSWQEPITFLRTK